MENTTTVLKNMASKILKEVEDFDNSECVTMQYRNFEEFFINMAHSRGWDKQRRENKFNNIQDAQMHMIQMLNDTIDNL